MHLEKAGGKIANLFLGDVGLKTDANRVAWLKKALAEIPAKSRLLDAGAGERRFQEFCSHLDYVSQDFDMYHGEEDGEGLHVNTWDQSGLDIVSDITAIPEPDGSFDVVLCTEVFEHIPQPILAIKEFSRLLKPGGILLLTAPALSGTHMAPFYFYSGFSKYFYTDTLAAFGFDIISIEHGGNFFDFVAQEIRRIPFMTKKYTKGRVSFLAYIALFFQLLVLKGLSRHDVGSGEFINCGYFVKAKKVRELS